MPSSSQRPTQEIVDEVNELAQTVVDQVTAFVSAKAGSRQAIEQAVLQGISLSTEALQQLTFLLDSAQLGRQATEPITEALGQVEQKLSFFQACTMRRSALRPYDDEADGYAVEAERLAREARARAAIYELVEAYKALEGIEARIVDLRGTAKTGSAPEPRVLDMPRARVLVARRAIGAAVVSLDGED